MRIVDLGLVGAAEALAQRLQFSGVKVMSCSCLMKTQSARRGARAIQARGRVGAGRQADHDQAGEADGQADVDGRVGVQAVLIMKTMAAPQPSNMLAMAAGVVARRQ